jgi:hypothetical protein
MSAEFDKTERRLLGSRRLRRMKDLLSENNLDSDKKLLGSRRLMAIKQTLVHGPGIEVKKQQFQDLALKVSTENQAPETASVELAVQQLIPSAASESVEKSIEVSASVAECFEAAAGFEDYPNWAGSVQYVKVLDKTEQGLGKTVEYAVGAFGRTLGYTLSYEFDYPRYFHDLLVTWVNFQNGPSLFIAVAAPKTRP